MTRARSVLAVCFCCSLRLASTADLGLAQDGTTTYRIVAPTVTTEVDAYAIQHLSGYLEQITGAEFPVLDPHEVDGTGKLIFVGVSPPALARLGVDPLPALKDQEHVCRSKDADIFLYGKGIHGNLYAVFEFLETSMGWRWFSLYEHPFVPSKPTVSLEPFHRKKGFDFAYRCPDFRQRSLDFRYQHGVNMGYDSRTRKTAWRHGKEAAAKLSEFVPKTRSFGGAHTLLCYIPPKKVDDRHYEFGWQDKGNYFETNPDFFSLWTNGKRVPNRQLCFANPQLRAALTRNVLKHADLVSRDDEELILAVTANDTPGPFCYCPGCKKLEEEYQSPGGPLYEYLIELCKTLHRERPNVLIKTLAYRESQTQRPPVLPEGERLPGNLIVDFAPIDDCYFADWWTHRDPEIQDTYRDLVEWGKITDHLWAWIYPNPWGTGLIMPVGNVERVVNNVRLMKYAGVERVFADHNGDHRRANFSELQHYLLIKLLKDVNCDTDALVREFTDNMYGAAAALIRKYLDELERCRKAMDPPPEMRYKSANYDRRTFPYLTVENIHRWQAYFDEMEQLLVGQPKRHLINTRLVRRELDFATLWRWFDLAVEFPEHYRDYTVFSKRIEAVNEARPQPWMNDGNANRTAWEKETDKGINRNAKPLGEAALRDFVTRIKAGGKEKPLPAQFDGIDLARVKTFTPQYRRGPGRGLIPDPEAPFGYAIPVKAPDLPFELGFYQNDTRTHGARRKLSLKEITPNAYAVYRLGEVDITPKCLIWFSARSWLTNLQLGDRLHSPGENNQWTAYVSLKFEGPTYNGKVDEKLSPMDERKGYQGLKPGDLVLVGRIILVKQ